MSGQGQGKKDDLTVASSGTREAVENAIDLSKGERTSTWDSVAKRSAGKIRRWDEKRESEVVEKRASQR